MRNVLDLFAKTCVNIESKKLISFFKKNNSVKIKLFSLFLIKATLIILLFNFILLSPLFLISNINQFLKVIIPEIIFIIIIFYVNTFLKIRNLEKLDKSFLNTSIHKSDFFKYLKNDIFFNLKFSIFLTFIFSFYQLLIYTVLLLTGNIKSIPFILIFLIFLVLFLIISSSINLIYFLRKRELKEVFFHINNYKNLKKNNLVFIIIFVIIFFIPILFVLNIFIKYFLLSILISLILSIILSIPINSYFKKTGIYSEKFWKNYFDKINFQFKLSFKKFDLNNYLTILKSFKIVYPIIIFILTFVVLNLLSIPLKLSFKTILFQSLLFPMFFIYPLLKINISYEKTGKRAFIFSVFISSLIFIIVFLNPVDIVNLSKKYQFFLVLKDFINPLLERYNNLCNLKNNLLNNTFLIFYFFIPIAFIILYLINTKLLEIRNFFDKTMDKKLKSKLNSENSAIIFGDSISKYPFLFAFLINFLIVSFLSIELPVFISFFSGIIDTLQISVIFNLKFLSKNNITMFFTSIFNILILIIILKLILQFISSFFSHFMLFTDEIVYIENKVFTNTILRIPVTKINYIIVKQNIIEKLLDIGSIFIETQDKNGLIKIQGITSIKQKNIQIMEKIKIGLQKTN